MANDPTKQDDLQDEPDAGGTAGGDDANTGGADLKDKHGEDAINLGHHNRLMAEKDAEIAKLQKQLEAASGEATKGADALKKVEALEAQLADEKVSGKLRLAGCVNEKAAKALLGDYEGDVEKLAKECPYLFGGNAGKQTGSTGAKRGAAPTDDEDEALDRAFGLKK